MEQNHDELMDDIIPESSCFNVFFQFDDDKPIQMATIKDGHKFSLTLDATDIGDPSIIFSNGNGKSFKFFMKCSSNH